MDVILVQPRQRLSRGPNRPLRHGSTPLGLLTIATPLHLAGYKVKIIHQETEADWERNLLNELKTRPICVGVTAMTGPPIWWALKASEIVKKNSDVPVVWGGVHPSLLPEQTLQSPYIDILVQGEGEETFLELVNALSSRHSLDKINGIWFKNGNDIKRNPPRPFIDLNNQPPISYHLVDLKKNMMSTLGRESLPFTTSRGCTFNCAFCYNIAFNERQWRALSAEQVLFRMKHAVDKYGVRAFIFSDDNFFTDTDRVRQILEGLVRTEMGIVWAKGDIRLDLLSKLDDDWFRLMEMSGCLSLVIGVESGSQRIADILRKSINVSDAVVVNRRLAQYKIYPRYLFLVGIPGETESDLKQTASLLLRLVKDNPKATVGIQILTPYPGTELFDLSVQHGLEAPQSLEEWVTFAWANRRLNYPWLSPERKKMLRMLSFCSYFAAEYNATLFTEISPTISILSKLYRPVAKRRISGFHYKFLPEQVFAELLGYKGY